MQVFRAALAGVSMLFVVTIAAQAQTLRDVDGPAERPPTSYAGKQYVDSRGCIFVRAGYGGQVDWVPRVDRKRNLICGQAPSLGAAAAAPRREQAQSRAVTAEPAAPVTPGTKRTTVRRKPAAAAPPVAARPGPTQAAAACRGASPLSTRYLRVNGARYKVRCGPQIQPVAGAASRQGTTRVRHQTAATAPRRTGAQTAAPIVIPKGYQAAYEEGRLNPRRGIGTAEGQAAMERIWTSTVPRRLRPVAKRVVVSRPAQQQVAVSTKRRAAAPAKPAATGGSFVQVAMFGDPGNARRTRQRLSAMGLPVRGRELVRSGKRYDVIYLGPFRDPGHLAAALGAARRAGFADAFAVK